MALLRLKGKLRAQLPVPCPAASGSWLPFLIGQVCHSPFGSPPYGWDLGACHRTRLVPPPYIFFTSLGGLRSARDPSPAFLIFVGFLRMAYHPTIFAFCFSSRARKCRISPHFRPAISRFSRVFVRFGRRSLTTSPPQSFILFVYLLFYDVYVFFSFIYPCPLSNLKGSKILPCPLPAGAVPV